MKRFSRRERAVVKSDQGLVTSVVITQKLVSREKEREGMREVSVDYSFERRTRDSLS